MEHRGFQRSPYPPRLPRVVAALLEEQKQKLESFLTWLRGGVGGSLMCGGTLIAANLVVVGALRQREGAWPGSS